MSDIASKLSGYDNDRYMVASCEKRLYTDVPEGVFCSCCGWKKKWDYTRPSFVLGKKKPDVSSTYDGACIVSSRFRDVALTCGADSSVFAPLPAEPGYFHLTPSRIVVFDLKRRKTKQSDYCRGCGLFAQTAGATPVMLSGELPAEGHIFRTDALFGSYHERSPLIILSGLFCAALKKARATGFHLDPIEPNQPPEPTAGLRPAAAHL